ncbi:DIP1984 family protein [Gulosibacter sediminis]|uniref:DIP1984 family protein n=1 Tax=Gulosibacter sediminis TaxID=1729695 RepID=UPI0018670474|nr:DIP1984 family protein [Gulosibacter sediminis]
MKLAEALIERAALQVHLGELRTRIRAAQYVQEGDTPPVDPPELLRDLEASLTRHTALVKAINHTNVHTPFDDARTITDAIADRDAAATRHRTYRDIADDMSAGTGPRQLRSEIRYVATMDARELQRLADDAARGYRELDTKLQSLNWTTELIEPGS